MCCVRSNVVVHVAYTVFMSLVVGVCGVCFRLLCVSFVMCVLCCMFVLYGVLCVWVVCCVCVCCILVGCGVCGCVVNVMHV